MCHYFRDRAAKHCNGSLVGFERGGFTRALEDRPRVSQDLKGAAGTALRAPVLLGPVTSQVLRTRRAARAPLLAEPFLVVASSCAQSG